MEKKVKDLFKNNFDKVWPVIEEKLELGKLRGKGSGKTLDIYDCLNELQDIISYLEGNINQAG